MSAPTPIEEHEDTKIMATQNEENEDSDMMVELEFIGFNNTDNTFFDQENTYNSLESCLTIDTLKEFSRRGIPLHTITWMDDDDCSIKTTKSEEQTILKVEDQPVMADYLLRVLTVNLDSTYPFKTFTVCTVCDETVMRNFNDLFLHAVSDHREIAGSLQCCLDTSCGLFVDCQALTNHWFLNHNDVLRSKITFNCTSCLRQFFDVVKFGKHICHLKEIVQKVSENTVCSECSYDFVSTRRLQFHQQFHSPTARPKICLVCFVHFDTDQAFYEHVTFAHEKVACFFCRSCDKCFSIKSQFLRHEKSHDEVKEFMCQVCNMCFSDPNKMTAHQLVHNEFLNQCLECKKCFTRPSQLRLHIKRNHVVHRANTLSVCNHCHEAFAESKMYENHITLFSEHEPADMSKQKLDFVACCEYCEAAFSSVAALKEHRTANHSETRTFNCQFCPKTFDAYTRNKTHSNSHKSLIKPFPVKRCYVCDQPNCDLVFDDWPRLQLHRKINHLVNPTVMRCNQCEEVFYQSWTMSDHKKRVHAKPMQCPLCEKTFIGTNNLNRHVTKAHIQGETDYRIIGREKRFQELIGCCPDGTFMCSECKCSINNRKSAFLHIKTMHPRTFLCDACPKQYPTNADLTKHIKRKHSNVGKYPCAHCDLRFTKTNALDDHIASTHPEFASNVVKRKRKYNKKKNKKENDIVVLDYEKNDSDAVKIFRVESALGDHEYSPTKKQRHPKKTAKTATELAISSIIGT